LGFGLGPTPTPTPTPTPISGIGWVPSIYVPTYICIKIS